MVNYFSMKHNDEKNPDRLQYNKRLKCKNHLYIRLDEYGESEQTC